MILCKHASYRGEPVYSIVLGDCHSEYSITDVKGEGWHNRITLINPSDVRDLIEDVGSGLNDVIVNMSPDEDEQNRRIKVHEAQQKQHENAYNTLLKPFIDEAEKQNFDEHGKPRYYNAICGDPNDCMTPANLYLWRITGTLDELCAIHELFVKSLYEMPSGDDDCYDYYPNALRMARDFACDIDKLDSKRDAMGHVRKLWDHMEPLVRGTNDVGGDDVDQIIGVRP